MNIWSSFSYNTVFLQIISYANILNSEYFEVDPVLSENTDFPKLYFQMLRVCIEMRWPLSCRLPSSRTPCWIFWGVFNFLFFTEASRGAAIAQ